MILMKMYFIVFVILLSVLGCASAKKEAKPQAVIPIKKSLKIEPVVETSTLNKENLIKEDAQTKVFQNCFKTGSINLEKKCQVKIDKFLKATSLKYKRSIYIDVHTDKGGSNKKNLLISNKRAKNIAGSLYYKEYKNSLVYYKGFGESKLIYNLETKEANVENRRVVVKLRPKNFKVDKKKYELLNKVSKNKKITKNKTNKKVNKQKTKKVVNHPKVVSQKSKKYPKLNIAAFTGQADTGWMYFGKHKLAKKLTITCKNDRPRKVKRKAISRSDRSEFMSTFYNREFSALFNDTEIKVSPVYIYENGKLPISNPMLSLKAKGKHTLRYQTRVNTYRGKKGILYRVFVNGKKKISCADFVVSYKDNKLSYGHVYMKDGKEFTLKNLK